VDDNNFKAIIGNGMEKASPDFTRNVMEGISKKAAPVFVHPRWKKWYRLAFIIVSSLAVGLSFLTGPAQQLVSTYVKMPEIPSNTILYIASYIVSFWILIAISYRFDSTR